MGTIHLVAGAGHGDVPRVEMGDLAPTFRAYNVMRRMGVRDLADLSRCSVSDLLSAKNCGVITAAEIYVQARRFGVVLPVGSAVINGKFGRNFWTIVAAKERWPAE